MALTGDVCLSLRNKDNRSFLALCECLLPIHVKALFKSKHFSCSWGNERFTSAYFFVTCFACFILSYYTERWSYHCVVVFWGFHLRDIFFSCILLLEKSKTSLADETINSLCHSCVMSFVEAHSFSSYIPLRFAISYLQWAAVCFFFPYDSEKRLRRAEVYSRSSFYFYFFSLRKLVCPLFTFRLSWTKDTHTRPCLSLFLFIPTFGPLMRMQRVLIVWQERFPFTCALGVTIFD